MPEPETIDVEVISETKDGEPLKAQPIHPAFEEAAQIFDHALETATAAVASAKEVGLPVEVPEAVRDTLETAAEGLREAGVKASEAQVAAGKVMSGIEKFGERMTQIRGGRGAFARRI